MKYSHNKGFTLVEIIVSIALASIILMLAGTLILSSSGYLTNTSNTDMSKRIVDSVIDFVRDEVKYSSDVRLVQKGSQYEPTIEEIDSGDWHYFYIKDGKLYRDDTKVFNDGFYDNGTFVMEAKGNFENSQRIDIKYSLKKDNNEDYSSKDTIMLLNFTASEEIMKNGLYTQNYKNLSQTEGTDRYILYYNKKYTKPQTSSGGQELGPGIEEKLTGTVADIRFNISGGNYLGVYKLGRSYEAKNGEIVWHNGYWWENVQYNDYREPGAGFAWKCLDMWYHSNSTYEKGDIILYDNNATDNLNNSAFYRYIGDSPAQETLLPNNSKSWEKIGSYNSSGIIEYVKEIGKYPAKKIHRKDNVVDKYYEFLPSNFQMFDPKKTMILEGYSSAKTYKQYDIVKDTSGIDSEYYDVYMKILNFDDHSLDIGVSTGWVKLDIFFDENSSYASGDIVRINTAESLWIIAKKDILTKTNPNDEVYTNHIYWDKLS